MPTVELFHLCDHAFLDERHNLCLMGVMTDVAARKYPYIRASITFAIVLRGTPGEEAHLKVELRDPRGSLLKRVVIDNQGSPSGISFLPFQFINVFFPIPGEYVATVSIGNQVLATNRVRIINPGSGPPPTVLSPAGGGPPE
jgi:hypothetical protein